MSTATACATACAASAAVLWLDNERSSPRMICSELKSNLRRRLHRRIYGSRVRAEASYARSEFQLDP